MFPPFYDDTIHVMTTTVLGAIHLCNFEDNKHYKSERERLHGGDETLHKDGPWLTQD